MSRERSFGLTEEGARGESRAPAAGQAPPRGASRSAETPPPLRTPVGLVATICLALGALLTICLWLGQLNPNFGVLANLWPWQLFHETPDGGAIAFVWDRYRAFALCVPVFGLAYLCAAIARPGRWRGAFTLFITFLAFISFLQEGAEEYFLAGMAAAALLAGAVIAREGVRGGQGGRGLVFVGLVLVAGQLFFPFPRLPSQEMEGREVSSTEYRAMFQSLRLVVERPEGTTLGDAIKDPAFAVVLSMSLIFLLGLASLLGMGGRWMAGSGAILLFVLTLAPVALIFVRGYGTPPATQTPVEAGFALVASWLQSRFGAFLLPLGAAMIDIARPARTR
jgi:hypothetical protein